MVHLPRQTPAGETEDREHQRDHRENSGDAADPSFKPGNRRSQHEREQDGECDRHEYGLRPVQDDNDEHTPGERHPPPQCLRRVIHKADRSWGSGAGRGSARTKARMIPRATPSDSNPASVEESAAAEQQHHEDDDE